MYGDSSEGRDLFEDFVGDDMAACEDGAEPAAQRWPIRLMAIGMDARACANEQQNVRAAEARALVSRVTHALRACAASSVMTYSNAANR